MFKERERLFQQFDLAPDLHTWDSDITLFLTFENISSTEEEEKQNVLKHLAVCDKW